MKKMKTITIILLSFILVLILAKYLYFGSSINIEYCYSQQSEFKLEKDSILFSNEKWLIISNEEQRKNWVNWGYNLPPVNFDINYLIISKYKIRRLYKKIWINNCTGVPNGKAIFESPDRQTNRRHVYYYYYMSKVLLSQGMG